MKNNTTELVFILDKSGSMASMTGDTVGGFNALIDKQKKEDGVCLVTTVLFNQESQRLHDRVPLSEVAPLTDREYTPGGCTALLDAVGSTIAHIEAVHRYIRPEDVPAHTLFVITTDGLENASHTYSAQKVKQMVSEKTGAGWEFLFLGANIDAVGCAADIGIQADRAADFCPDGRGMNSVFRSLSRAVGAARKGQSMDEVNWCAEVTADFEKRGK